MPPLSNLIALALLIVVMVVVFRKPFLAMLASRSGIEAEALVTSSELTSTMDERKRYYHRVVLEVQPTEPGRAPFVATAMQVLPWMSGNPPTGLRLKVRYMRGAPGAVYIVGPVPPSGAV
jgi:hypothetical protein